MHVKLIFLALHHNKENKNIALYGEDITLSMKQFSTLPRWISSHWPIPVEASCSRVKSGHFWRHQGNRVV